MGFSPNELVFAHTVRGPMAVLAAEWGSESAPENVVDYVRGFQRRLYEACAAAQRKLGKAQGKMQRLFNHQERKDIVNLVEAFPSLFPDVPTCTTVIEHDIDIGSSQSVKQHAYRVNPKKRELLRREEDYLLAHDFVEPSSSAWSSPCLLVLKPDGTHRFCTDYRRLNSVTRPDCYPLPRIDDCVDRVGSADFISKFDLLKGSWQVPLTLHAKELSAFVTPDNFLQYKVMPFGVRNASATFQRLMNQVLVGLKG
ncbi:hypothetical protein MHYP_G00170800 [Metynnis hypsauchen]